MKYQLFKYNNYGCTTKDKFIQQIINDLSNIDFGKLNHLDMKVEINWSEELNE